MDDGGGGILHIEKPPEALVVSGGLFHGLQLWVNLPRASSWLPPAYQDLRASSWSRFWPRRTAEPSCVSSPGILAATGGRAPPTPRSRWSTQR